LSFRDAFPRFEGLNAVILGVSPDDVASHQRFRKKHKMPFHLLADTEHDVAEKFGVWGEKKNYGRTYMGIIRSAFLIDEKGKVAEAWYKISPKDTPTKLLKALEA
jgi:peroxiredoxin Q/BCP